MNKYISSTESGKKHVRNFPVTEEFVSSFLKVVRFTMNAGLVPIKSNCGRKCSDRQDSK